MSLQDFLNSLPPPEQYEGPVPDVDRLLGAQPLTPGLLSQVVIPEEHVSSLLKRKGPPVEDDGVRVAPRPAQDIFQMRQLQKQKKGKE